jgi:predicted site-specific integrase-resolvase
MKLSDFAEMHGVCYRTAWNWWKQGKLIGVQSSTGTILVEGFVESKTPDQSATLNAIAISIVLG